MLITDNKELYNKLKGTLKGGFIMSQLKKSEYMVGLVLPSGFYFYKIKNGKNIYLNQYKDEFYIVYPEGTGFRVETYYGQCDC